MVACSIGEHARQEAPGNSGKNISLIGGMSIDGLIATLSVVGSVNTEVFLFYIQQILIPQLWVGAIIVMDNVHHALVVREAVKRWEKVVFCRPIPDLSPIELCWSKLKQLLPQPRLELVKHWIKLTRIITECISADDALGWFAHCGLFI